MPHKMGIKYERSEAASILYNKLSLKYNLL